MTKDDILKMFEGTKPMKTHVSAANVSALMRFVNVSLEMDSKNLDYYYNITINEIINSDIPIKLIEDMVKTGWFLDKDKENIRVFLYH